MSKRFLLILSLILIAALSIAACGKTTEEPVVTAAPEKTEAAPEKTEEPMAGVPAGCEVNPDETICAVFEPGDTIKIGYAGPMAGDYAAFGIDISQGAQIAVDQAGDIKGFSVELLVEDTQGSGEGGAAVANLYSSNPDVVAIAGHTFSGSTEAAIPIYNASRRPMLSPSATKETLTQGDQDVFNRIPFTDGIQGTKAAEYLFNKLGFTTIAIMHDGDAYGQGLAQTVNDVFTSLGGTVVALEAINPGETDYTAALTSIGAASPQAIYYGGYYPEAAVIANNLGVAGLGNTVLFTDDGSYGETFLELAGPSAEGVIAGAAGQMAASAALDAFNTAYFEAWGEQPGVLSTFTWHGFDIASALISVIEKVAVLGGDGNLYINREAMVAGVRGLTGFQGLTGEISCNAVGECNAAGPTFYIVENGEWVVADPDALVVEEPMSSIPAECLDDKDEVACAVFAPGEVIKIGYAGPMAGDYAAFGIDISQGAQIAFDQAGDVSGFGFELLVEDTQGSGEGGAAVANLYSSNPDVVAIAGHTFSGSTEAAIPIYNASRRPMLSPSATKETLTQGDQDVFNRIPFTDGIQGTKAAEYLYNTLGYTSIAIMHDGDAYGQGLAQTVNDVFTSLGGTVVALEAINPGETDYTAALTAIGAAGPQAIYYGGYYPEAAVIANNMAVAGLPGVTLFTDDGSYGETFLELAGPSAEGVIAGAAGQMTASPALDAFNAAYFEKWGEQPGVLSTFTWHGYDIASALISVAKSVAVLGEDGNLYISRDAMVAGVRGLSGFQGLTGEITCNAVGECNAAGPTFYIVENGEWVVAP